MSRFKELNGLKTEPPAPKPDLLDPTGLVPILFGSDGFVTYCTACERVVNPLDLYGRHMRSCVTGALVDRANHLKETHP